MYLLKNFLHNPPNQLSHGSTTNSLKKKPRVIQNPLGWSSFSKRRGGIPTFPLPYAHLYPHNLQISTLGIDMTLETVALKQFTSRVSKK